MPDEPPQARSGRSLTQAARWRLRSNRQIWLLVLAPVIVICAEAIALPAKRGPLTYAVAALVGIGVSVTTRRRQRRDRAAIAARSATASRDDMPADVIGLVAAGKKIQAIKHYRKLTGAGLREAKGAIDSL